MALKKYLTEILEEINKNPKKLEEYKTDPDIDLLFKYAFHPNGKMILPEGEPPYKPDMGMYRWATHGLVASA